MLVVPLQAVPNQTLQVTLGNQPCILNVYQYSTGLFMDVYISATPIITGVICHNICRIVRSLYLGFIGDFVFYDTQGNLDPIYTGLGSRYILVYLTPSDLGGLG
jgi:hypothetical protein